jgi:hypothetical protein
MLIQVDKNELGDKRLDPKEGVAKLKEDNRKLAAKNRIPNQSLLEDVDMAVGNPMAPAEFIRKIRLLSNDIIVEQGGIPNAVAVRIIATDDDKESPTYGQKIKKYVSGFYVDRMLPEFSAIIPDHLGQAKREIRGWRSVLLSLWRSKVVTLRQLVAVFGHPNGQRNSLWMQQTREQR